MDGQNRILRRRGSLVERQDLSNLVGGIFGNAGGQQANPTQSDGNNPLGGLTSAVGSAVNGLLPGPTSSSSDVASSTSDSSHTSTSSTASTLTSTSATRSSLSPTSSPTSTPTSSSTSSSSTTNHVTSSTSSVTSSHSSLFSTQTSTLTFAPSGSTTVVIVTTGSDGDTVTSTSVQAVAASSFASPSTTPHSTSFLSNKPLEGAVFGLVGLIALVLLVIIGTLAIRRSRRNRLDSEFAAAVSFDPDATVHTDRYVASGDAEKRSHGDLERYNSNSSNSTHGNATSGGRDYASGPDYSAYSVPRSPTYVQGNYYQTGQSQGYQLGSIYAQDYAPQVPPGFDPRTYGQGASSSQQMNQATSMPSMAATRGSTPGDSGLPSLNTNLSMSSRAGRFQQSLSSTRPVIPSGYGDTVDEVPQFPRSLRLAN